MADVAAARQALQADQFTREEEAGHLLVAIVERESRLQGAVPHRVDETEGLALAIQALPFAHSPAPDQQLAR